MKRTIKVLMVLLVVCQMNQRQVAADKDDSGDLKKTNHLNLLNEEWDLEINYFAYGLTVERSNINQSTALPGALDFNFGFKRN